MRKFSLRTLQDIIKAAGPLMRSHLAEVVGTYAFLFCRLFSCTFSHVRHVMFCLCFGTAGTMLELLSALEPQQLTYMQQHAQVNQIVLT